MAKPLSRGDIILCPDGAVALVWSVSLGLAHCFPCSKILGNGPVLQPPNGPPLRVDVAHRRHPPVSNAPVIGAASAELLAEVAEAHQVCEANARSHAVREREQARVRAARYRSMRRAGPVQAAQFG